VYYFAQAQDNLGITGPNFIQASDPTGADLAKLSNAISPNVATAANARTSGTSGVMPATLGTLTPVSDVTSVGIGAPLWTP
jgi:hypothetical protein